MNVGHAPACGSTKPAAWPSQVQRGHHEKTKVSAPCARLEVAFCPGPVLGLITGEVEVRLQSLLLAMSNPEVLFVAGFATVTCSGLL